MALPVGMPPGSMYVHNIGWVVPASSVRPSRGSTRGSSRPATAGSTGDDRAVGMLEQVAQGGKMKPTESRTANDDGGLDEASQAEAE